MVDRPVREKQHHERIDPKPRPRDGRSRVARSWACRTSRRHDDRRRRRVTVGQQHGRSAGAGERTATQPPVTGGSHIRPRSRHGDTATRAAAWPANGGRRRAGSRCDRPSIAPSSSMGGATGRPRPRSLANGASRGVPSQPTTGRSRVHACLPVARDRPAAHRRDETLDDGRPRRERRAPTARGRSRDCASGRTKNSVSSRTPSRTIERAYRSPDWTARPRRSTTGPRSPPGGRTAAVARRTPRVTRRRVRVAASPASETIDRALEDLVASAGVVRLPSRNRTMSPNVAAHGPVPYSVASRTESPAAGARSRSRCRPSRTPPDGSMGLSIAPHC